MKNIPDVLCICMDSTGMDQLKFLETNPMRGVQYLKIYRSITAIAFIFFNSEKLK